jgi:hypothetical protein
MSDLSLPEAYNAYLLAYAPIRPTSFAMGPIVDFVETLREQQIDASYSDEEWIAFLLPFADGDQDKARDLWDALLCQPTYDHGPGGDW